MENGSKCCACDRDIPASRGSRPRRWCSDRCRSWARKNAGKKRPEGRACRGCGESIEHLILKAIFCTDRCKQRYKAKERKAATPLRQCLHCGKEFKPYRENSRWCSVRHYRTWWQKQWTAANPGEVRRLRIETRARRSEEQRAHLRALGRLYAQVRRARKRQTLVIPFTEDQLDRRLSMFSGCWMCGGPSEHIDHVKPLAKGGPHILANLRPSCRPCNLRKGYRWPLEVGRAVERTRVRR